MQLRGPRTVVHGGWQAQWQPALAAYISGSMAHPPTGTPMICCVCCGVVCVMWRGVEVQLTVSQVTCLGIGDRAVLHNAQGDRGKAATYWAQHSK